MGVSRLIMMDSLADGLGDDLRDEPLDYPAASDLKEAWWKANQGVPETEVTGHD